MALTVKPQNLDVNVHPTKNEVHILNEDDIIKEIQKIIETRLLQCNNSRSFDVQQTLTDHTVNSPSASQTGPAIQPTPQQRIRTDSRAQPLTAFFQEQKNEQPTRIIDTMRTANQGMQDHSPVRSRMDNSVPLASHVPAPATFTDDIEDVMDDEAPATHTTLTKRSRAALSDSTNSVPVDGSDDAVEFQTQQKQSRQRTVKPVLLTSVSNLIAEVEKIAHKGLSELFHNFTFVGCANCNFALIQHRTKLYLTRVSTLRLVRTSTQLNRLILLTMSVKNCSIKKFCASLVPFQSFASLHQRLSGS